jgi:hypothetical protein
MGDPVAVKEDLATAVLNAFRASPWFGVIGLAVAVTTVSVKGQAKLEANERDTRRAQATADTAKTLNTSLADSIRSVKTSVDALNGTTNAILCALDPEQTAAVERCREYRINRRPRRPVDE